MDFNFTAEQEMLRDSVARYFGDHYAFAQRQGAIRSEEGWRLGFWRGLADDVGVLGAPFSEALGGLGGGAVENMIVMEEIGKALVEKGLLQAHDLFKCLTEQVSEIFHTMMLAREGAFVCIDQDLDDKPQHTVNVSMQSLLMDSIRKIDDLRKQNPDFDRLIHTFVQAFR